MNNREREEIGEAINNYITYSREHLLLAHNVLAFTSRNDERLYNLMTLYLRNNQSINNDNIPNSRTIFTTPSMTNNMHRNNDNRNTRARRFSNSSGTRNVRSRQNPVNNRRSELFSNMSAQPGNSLFSNNTGDNELTNAFLGALANINNQNADFVNSLESVPVIPSNEEITRACEDVSFNTISNPINSSCPINLERFTNNSTVTQILYCGHCYDPVALRRWFTSNVRCPICRYDIRNYNPMDVIRNPYRRIIRNPNTRHIIQRPIETPVERPNNFSVTTESTIIPESEPTSDPTIDTVTMNNMDLSFSSFSEENYNILPENYNDEEYTVNNFINNNLADEMRNNLNAIIINDLSNSNLTFSDISNNGQGPIIDLSYQIFFN
tara:strand:+ start:1081 stop:2223 length:1143 start_codon:yes stop_codon:yes gene_type:complete